MILSAEPQLFVSDIRASLAWFNDLGFETIFCWGDPTAYAQVAREGGRINLRHVDGAVFDAGFRQRERDALSVTFTVDDAASLYDEFDAAGATFHQELHDEEWGTRTFILADPDGNLILFAGS
jgi:catechol 2,3-dioxygenase-like lactoylglutathione lyase family enzyme